MNSFIVRLQLTTALFMASVSCAGAFANEARELALGTLSCKAEWNEFCEDQNTVSVPEGHKLCKHNITVKQQSGDSSYSLVSTDTKSVTVKFSAKGNRDRFKQQSAHIVLEVALLGVRDDKTCVTGEVASTAALPTSQPAPQPLARAVTETTTVAPEEKITPATAPAITLPKVHACACSQWIDAGKVTNCLQQGHARDNVSCESFSTTIQCVTSRDECREIQKDDCYQVMGLNQTTSQKRIYVADSPYCHALLKK